MNKSTREIFVRTMCVSLNDIDDGISPDVRCEEFIECITRKEKTTTNLLMKKIRFLLESRLLLGKIKIRRKR